MSGQPGASPVPRCAKSLSNESNDLDDLVPTPHFGNLHLIHVQWFYFSLGHVENSKAMDANQQINIMSHFEYPHQIIIYVRCPQGSIGSLKKKHPKIRVKPPLESTSDATCFRRPRIPCRPLHPKGGKETAGSCRSFC